MDTRKLTSHIDHDHGGRIEADGWGITAHIDHAEDPQMIAELVRRWNAYPMLVEMLERIAEDANDLLNFRDPDQYKTLRDSEQEARELLETLKA